MFLLVLCKAGKPYSRRLSSTDAGPWRSPRRSFSGSCVLRVSVSVLSIGRAGGNPFVKILRQGGRGCTLLIDTLTVETFYADLLEGKCQPPPMPGERKKDAIR